MTFSFPIGRRLCVHADFDRVFAAPQWRSSDRYFTVLARQKEGNTATRLGIIVAKKNVRRANKRNRIKRLLRESFRHCQFNNIIDVVVIAKYKTQHADNKDIFCSLNNHWRRLQL